MRYKKFVLFWSTLVLAFGVSACQTQTVQVTRDVANEVGDQSGEPIIENVVVDDAVPEPTLTSTPETVAAQDERTPTLEPAATVDPTATGEVVQPPPVKDELTATNPSSVNLATGEPQLIEFFAFW